MTGPMNRRNCLQAIGGGLASAAMTGSISGEPLAAAEQSPPDTDTAPRKFTHRGYLGWITDLATVPAANEAWPSMRLDERLLRDYSETFDVMKHIGMNEISIWGLYVSRSWPVDIPGKKPSVRGSLAEGSMQAEDAYCRYLPANMCATISLESLVSSRPGPAIYLRDRLGQKQRAAYRRKLVEISDQADKLRNDVRRSRFDVLKRCIQNTIRDLDNLKTNQ